MKRLSICALAATMSAVLKGAAANTDDSANGFTDEISDLVPSTGEREMKKGLERFFGRDCGTGKNDEWWQHCTHLSLLKYDGPLLHPASGKELYLKQIKKKTEGSHVTSLGK